jgi:hypothetical protein
MESVSSIIPILLDIACPCRFPRFRRAVGFNFEEFGAGPVACRDTEELVIASYHGTTAFLQQRSERWIQDSTHRGYQCNVCLASWEAVFTDYNINMSRPYLRAQTQVLPDVGAEAELPFPIVSGFRAFKEVDVKKCAADYKQVALQEFVSYMSKCR